MMVNSCRTDCEEIPGTRSIIIRVKTPFPNTKVLIEFYISGKYSPSHPSRKNSKGQKRIFSYTWDDEIDLHSE